MDPHSPASRRRRGLPVVTAALVLGLTGGGAGFVAGRHLGHPETSAAGTASTPSTTDSRRWMRRGYSGYPDSSTYGGLSGQQTEQQTGQQPDQQLQQGSSPDATSTATSRQLTGLVRIVSTLAYEDGTAAGTGLVLRSDGEVITNHHVVEGATTVKATVMSTGRTYTAKVVGTDAGDDVAVLQLVGATGLSTVTADTGTVSTGDTVTAVGDGNGTTDHLSAATGTVLATGQSITTESEGSVSGERLSNLIEISSDVVGGYSGGATYDADGKVVGMTTAASTDEDPVGYAIPIATVTSIARDIEAGTTSADYAYGYPAFLGVGLSQGSGPTVEQVYDGTPAAKAGLTQGSTITAIDGTATATTTKLRSVLAQHQPGDQVQVSWTDASGVSHTETMTLAKGPVA